MFAVFLNQSYTSGSEEKIRLFQMEVEPRLILIYFIRETDTNNQCKIATSKLRKTVE